MIVLFAYSDPMKISYCSAALGGRGQFMYDVGIRLQCTALHVT